MNNLFIILSIAGVVLIVGILVFNGHILAEEKWQAAYYPDSCLTCEDEYIFSPFFQAANDCINWVHEKAATRNGHNDAAECSLNCKKDYELGGILVCEETIDVLGKPSI